MPEGQRFITDHTHGGIALSRRSFLGLAGATVLSIAAGGLAGCAGADETSGGGSSGDSKTITVAFVTNGKPTSFYKEDGKTPDGYDIDVINAVAAKLTDYTFEFEGVDQPAVYAGLASNRYQIGLTNAFWTPERAENYLQPSQNIGATVLGFLTRKEHEGVKTLKEAADNHLRLCPILAGDGNYYVVEDYNKQNPNDQIELKATDDPNAFVESFGWVADGRYDLHVVPLQYYDALVTADDGAYHEYADQLSFRIIGATKTWSFMSKESADFEKVYSQALKELKDEGKMSEFSKKWYGIDNFQYITDDSKTYNFIES